MKLGVFGMIGSEWSWAGLLYRVCAVYWWNTSLPMWIYKGGCTVAETSVRSWVITIELRRFYECFRPTLLTNDVGLRKRFVANVSGKIFRNNLINWKLIFRNHVPMCWPHPCISRMVYGIWEILCINQGLCTVWKWGYFPDNDRRSIHYPLHNGTLSQQSWSVHSHPNTLAYCLRRRRG